MDTVLKPIKDGIMNWLKGIKVDIELSIIDYRKEESIEADNIENLIGSIFGSIFIDVILIIIVIIGCVQTIVCPFLSIVNGLLSSVTDFVSDIITEAFASFVGGNYEKIIEDIKSGKLISTFKFVLGINQEKTKGEQESTINIANFIFCFITLIFSYKARKITSLLYQDVLKQWNADKDNIELWNKLESKKDAKRYAAGGLILAIIAIVIALFDVPPWQDEIGQYAPKGLALIIAFIGLILAYLSIRIEKDIISGIGLGVAIFGVIIAIVTILDELKVFDSSNS
jgi:hypothetical protein